MDQPADTHDVGSGTSQPSKAWLLPLLAFLFAAVLYIPSIEYGFTIDDPLVTDLNPQVSADDGGWWRCLDTTLYAGTPQAKKSGNLYRPALTLSLVMDYRLGDHRFQPARFHLTNILLYALCAAVASLVVSHLLRGRVKRAGLATWAVSMTFIAFPGHLESVCNVKHREEILALLFGLLAWREVLAHNGRMSWSLVVLTSFLFLCALASKESTILLLPCMVLWEWRQGVARPRRWAWAIGCLAATAIYLGMRYHALGALLSPSGTHHFYSPALDTVSRVSLASTTYLRFYVWDQLIGLQLNPFFSSPFVVSHTGPALALDAFALLSLMASAVGFLIWFWRTGSVFAFAGVFVIVNSAVTLHIVPMGTAGAFRLMFAPSFGMCLLLGGILVTRKQAWLGLALVPILVVYTAVTWTRMPIWSDNASVMSHAAKANPEDPLASFAAAQAYGVQGDDERRSSCYRAAFERFERFKDERARFDERWLFSYAFSMTEVAHSRIASAPSEALTLANRAIQLFLEVESLRGRDENPAVLGPMYVKAATLKEMGRKTEAIAACEEGLSIGPHRGLQAIRAELQEK